jgi:DNA-binding XRE family transcriptional regulator
MEFSQISIESVHADRQSRSVSVRLSNGKHYIVRLDELPYADSSGLVRARTAPHKEHFVLKQTSGNSLEIPWDEVLARYEPDYPYHISKTVELAKRTRVRIAKRIREHRKRSGLSHDELAVRARLQEADVREMESGQHDQNFEMVEKIARALKIPVYVLVSANPDAPKPD